GELQAKLHVALRASSQNRVETQPHVRRCKECSKSRRTNISRVIRKHRAVQNIKYFPTESHRVTFGKLESLKQSHVELRNAWLPQAVAPRGSQRSILRRRER